MRNLFSTSGGLSTSGGAARALPPVALLLVLFALPAGAQQQQGARIKLDSLDKLTARAAQVESKEETPKSGEGKVYVRRFKFGSAGQFTDADLAEVRAQLAGPGWSRFMKVVERDDEPDENENVEIYVYGKAEGSDVYAGMTIIATQTKELTVVNIVGEGKLDDVLKKAGAKKPER